MVQLTAFATNRRNSSSTSPFHAVIEKALGQNTPSSRFAASLKPIVE